MTNIMNIAILFAISTLLPLCRANVICGGLLYSRHGVISTPQDSSGEYPSHAHCEWEIIAPRKYTITLSISKLSIEYEEIGCKADYLEIYSVFDDGKIKKHSRYCGSYKPFSVTSVGNYMKIIFVSDYMSNFKGLRATYIATWTDIADYVCCDFTGYEQIRTEENNTDYARPFINYDAWPVVRRSNFMERFLAEARLHRFFSLLPYVPSLAVSTETAIAKGEKTEITTPAISLGKAIKWALDLLNQNVGFGKETPRVATALMLAGPNSIQIHSKEWEKMTDQLELQLSYDILRNETFTLNTNRISVHLNAFMSTCLNVRNLNYINLVQMLNDSLESDSATSPTALLSLCLAGESKPDDVTKLQNLLSDPVPVGTAALAVMALTCLSKKPDFIAKDLLELQVFRLKAALGNKGSNVNLHKAALITQALNAYYGKDGWKSEDVLHDIIAHQQYDGSFGNVLATYEAILALSGNSLLNISYDECSDYATLADTSPLKLMGQEKSNMMHVSYSLWYHDPVQGVSHINMTVPDGMTFLKLMRLAQSENDAFRFEAEEFSGKVYVYSIAGIPNDDQQSIYWSLYTMDGTTAPLQPSDSNQLKHLVKDISKQKVADKDQFVFWYK